MRFNSVVSHIDRFHFSDMNAMYTLSILYIKNQSINKKEVFINV